MPSSPRVEPILAHPRSRGEVVQGTMAPSQLERLRYGPSDVPLRPLHRLFKLAVQSELRGDGRRERAARPVGVLRRDAGPAVVSDAASGVEYVAGTRRLLLG